MKKIIIYTLILLGLTGFINARTSVANSSAQILTPIIVSSINNLSFGNLTTGAAGHTVFTLDTQDNITVTLGGGATVGAGMSDGEGIKTGKVRITAQAGQEVIVYISGGGSIAKGSVRLRAGYYTPQSGINIVPASGYFDVLIGGVLTVPSSAPAGVYNGTYNIYFTY